MLQEHVEKKEETARPRYPRSLAEKLIAWLFVVHLPTAVLVRDAGQVRYPLRAVRSGVLFCWNQTGLEVFEFLFENRIIVLNP